MLLRYADLALLALALPVFVLADLPLVGYAAIAAAWLVQHAMLAWADRASAAALARGERNRAMGIVGGTRSAASGSSRSRSCSSACSASARTGSRRRCSAFALVTVHLGCLAITKLLDPKARA